jgi:hypothetical protein
MIKALLNEEGKKVWGYVFPDSEVPVRNIAVVSEINVNLIEYSRLMVREIDARIIAELTSAIYQRYRKLCSSKSTIHSKEMKK